MGADRICSLIVNALYWIHPATLCGKGSNPSYRKAYWMTYLDVVFSYGAAPGEKELRAIDSMREVYGVRRVEFNEKERTVRVEVAASRIHKRDVAALLRTYCVDHLEPRAL